MNFINFGDVQKYNTKKNIFVADGTPHHICLKKQLEVDCYESISNYSDYDLEKDLICAYKKKCLQQDFLSINNIMITSGATQALYMVFSSLLPSGNIIVLGPAWSMYKQIGEQLNIEIKTVLPDDLNTLYYDMGKIIKLIDENTKAILFASPSNPLCKRLNKNNEIDLFYICKKHGIQMIVDETYHGLQYKKAYSILDYKNAKDYIENIIVIRSMSKFFCAAGLRIGYIIASKNKIRKLGKIKNSMLLTVSRSSIYKSIHIINNIDYTWHKKTCFNNLNNAISIFNCSEAFSYFIPDSAFFLCFRLKINDKYLSAEELYKNTLLVVRDGKSFGLENYYRINLCYNNFNDVLQKLYILSKLTL